MARQKPFRRLDSQTVARRFKQRVVRQYFVRFHMSLLLAATTSCGVIASKLMLMAGLTSVTTRYPLAVLSAYLVFLGLTRLWVVYVLLDVRRPGRDGSGFGADMDWGSLDAPWPGGGSGGGSGGGAAMRFGGGDSGGGGASDVWAASDSSGSGFRLPSLDWTIDFEDGMGILLVLAAVVLVIFGAGAYLIYLAPEILPEIALNALLASCLTGAAKRAEAKGWLRSVFSATWVPLLLILVVTAVLAVTVHKTCPGAPRLVDALNCPDRPAQRAR
jgi:hypothetical protein